MNKNDSEYLAGMLEFNGYKPAAVPEQANILVLNTCSVRDKAERRVYGQLAKFQYLRRTQNLDQKIFLSGCMPAYDKAEIKKRAPFLDGFLEIEEAKQYPPRRADSAEVWVTIMQGCDNFCAYCIVPYVRGRERSRSAEDIAAEINRVDFAGHEILFLLGQNVNSYSGTNSGQKISFPQLLQKILRECPAVPRLTFLTSHPKDMTGELIETIAENKKIDREIHLPAQAGNDRILQLMNRGYTSAHYLDLLTRIRARVPDAKISTDLIVGFPSETEAEFQDTCRLVETQNFFRVNTASFSARKGTAAAALPPLAQGVIDERLNKLNKLVHSVKPVSK
ncbi:tRNA (N6-isopentenyl adenosine(37)-C2)-methylthiotransferase MiaB [Candidatus Termititenax spirochaetophilus]|uniref:tRNA (N6-isopentenyl adenosine(37)-C2)-methylthiotransferase MiaB n=1 Tax=Candidatus Termititenax spirochaetophilus TaxID=2218522 RepID=A0A388T6P9_9BACT|nr:tRNA (N6-isopentenyl adenosine(37)-C2)-methylthiotransferase MiaB [Candidatus Termititenax spirochaetophilus]